MSEHLPIAGATESESWACAIHYADEHAGEFEVRPRLRLPYSEFNGDYFECPRCHTTGLSMNGGYCTACGARLLPFECYETANYLAR